jgi:hypothetical protein
MSANNFELATEIGDPESTTDKSLRDELIGETEDYGASDGGPVRKR